MPRKAATTYLAVDFEPDISSTEVFVNATDGENLDDKSLALLDGDVHLLSNSWLAQEVSGWDHTENSIKVSPTSIFL